MPVINNTYQGLDPQVAVNQQAMANAANLLAQGLQAKKAREAQAASEAAAIAAQERAGVFQTLDTRLQDMYSQYGSLVFSPYLEASEGEEGAEYDLATGTWRKKNEFYDQAKAQLQGAADAFATLGGNRDAYMAQFLSKPYSGEQTANLKFALGDFLKNQSKVQGPAEGTGTGTEQSGDDLLKAVSLVPKTTEVVPEEGKSTSTQPVSQETTPKKELLTPEIEGTLLNILKPIEVNPNSGLLKSTKQLILKVAPEISNGPIKNAEPTETFRQFLIKNRNLLPEGAEFTTDPNMPDSELLIKNNPKAFEKYLESQRFWRTEGYSPEELDLNPGRTVAPVTMTRGPYLQKAPGTFKSLLPQFAGGTGVPGKMTPAQLARHEARTGDVHIPALVGLKEGIVNSRAMQAGGSDIVRLLNQAFPVYAGGTMGTVEDTGGGPAPMPAPAPRTASKSQLVGQISSILGEVAPVSKGPSAKTLQYKAISEKAAAEGNGKKAQAAQVSALKQEERDLVKSLTSPVYVRHTQKLMSGIDQFLGTASDEQLAYYGFEKVLSARQQKEQRDLEKKKYEEDLKTGAVQRSYLTSQTKAADAGTTYSNAQLKLLEAQTKKVEAEEALVLARMEALGSGTTDIETSKELVLTMMKEYDPETLNTMIQKNSALQLAFDIFAKYITENASATWTTIQKKTGVWNAIASFFGADPYETVSSPYGGGGPQSTATASMEATPYVMSDTAKNLAGKYGLSTTLSQIESDPKFAKLNFSDQTALRAQFFDTQVAAAPDFAALDVRDQQMLFNQTVNRVPVLETKESDFMRAAADVTLRMQLGDTKAIDDAVSLSAWRTGTKQMLIPTLVAKGIDAIANLFDPDRKDPLFNDFYGQDGDKIDSWLQMQVGRFGGEGALSKLAGSTFAIGAVGGFAEFALMTIGLSAVGSAIGKAAGAGAKGASIARGILTGEHLNAVTYAAMGKVQALSAPLLRNLAALTVEGVQSGVVQTGLDMLRIGLQDGFRDKTHNEAWTAIAQSFGVNVAMNYVGWAAFKALGTVGKAAFKAIKGYDLDPTIAWREAFSVESNPAVRMASEGYGAGVVLPDEALMRSRRIDPKSELGLAVFTQANGWELRKASEGKYSLTSIENPNLVLEGLDRASAVRRVAEIASTGVPAVEIKPKNLSKTLKGLTAAEVTTTQLVEQVSYKIKGAVDPEKLTRLLYPENGVVKGENLTFFGKNYLISQGVPEEVAKQLTVELHGTDLMGRKTSAGLNIVVDAKVQTTGDEASLVGGYIRDLDKIVKAYGTGEAKVFRPVPPDLAINHASLTAVKAAGEKLGIPVTIRNNGVEIDGVKYSSTREANAVLLGRAFEQGKLSTEQVSALIQSRTGLSLHEVDAPVVSPGGVAERLSKKVGGDPSMTTHRFTLTKPVGKGQIVQVASAPDLPTLFRENPNIDPTLPSYLAPDYWIVDPSASTLTVQTNIATGSAEQLLELSGRYSSPTRDEIIQSFGKGTLSKVKGSSRYVLRNADVGVYAEFSTKAQATKAMGEAVSTSRAVQLGFAYRDMHVSYEADGSLVATAVDGSGKVFKSLREASDWLKATPKADWVGELTPVEPTLLAEAEAQVADAVELETLFKGKKPTKSSALGQAVSKYTFPTEAHLVNAARKEGDWGLVKSQQDLRKAFRLEQGITSKLDAKLNALFKGTNNEQQIMYQVLLGNDEKQWGEIAERAFNVALDEKDLTVLRNLQGFYDEAFIAAGLPDWKRVVRYAPRIRDYALKHQDDIVDIMSADEYLKQVFGFRPVGLEFYGERARATDVLQVALMENAADVAKTYTRLLTRHKYLDPVIKDADTFLKNATGKYSKDTLDYYRGSIEEFIGLTKSKQYAIFQRDSRKLITGIQGLMQKIPGLRKMPLADGKLVGDVIDIFNSKVTVATQAKPWATFRNMMQINLLGAAIGDNKVMWEAFRDVINEADDVTVKRLIKTGAIQGVGFMSTGSGASVGYWRSLMKWNENMDILTRASSFKAAEKLLTRNWDAFKAGILDATTFGKRAGLSILDDVTRLKVVDAMRRGDVTGAVDEYGDALNRLCFFDYSKSNRAFFQRGAVGKVFGKFGTYPAGTLALYQRILSSGSAGEKVARAGRIVLSSLAIYEGAKAMGVQYSGFLFTDPFSFQGGPLWQILADGSSIVGDSSQAKAARTTLLKNLPRLLSPTVNTFKQVQKALTLLDTGDVYSAAVALTGAPVRKDLAWAERSGF